MLYNKSFKVINTPDADIVLVILLKDLETFCKTLEQILLIKVSECNYPVCLDFPLGQQKNNFALKYGVIQYPLSV